MAARSHDDRIADDLATRYGQGENGPGHCFHQHLCYCLRATSPGWPPSVAYADYVLAFPDLWPALAGRRHIFDAAARHFEGYLERTDALRAAGLRVDRIPYRGDALERDVRDALGAEAIVLAAVDTFHLPTFSEHERVHGLTIVALTAAGGGRVRLWHWENSAEVPRALLARAIEEQGRKLWRVDLRTGADPDPRERVGAAIAAHARLQRDDELAPARWRSEIEAMLAGDPSMPADPAEWAILFHVPYRRCADGEFRAAWLVRSVANRLMHCRAGFEELVRWATADDADAALERLADTVHEAFRQWKALNVLCARYDARQTTRMQTMIVDQLGRALEHDAGVGRLAAALAETRTNLLGLA
jgi:hypothetical protein